MLGMLNGYRIKANESYGGKNPFAFKYDLQVVSLTFS